MAADWRAGLSPTADSMVALIGAQGADGKVHILGCDNSGNLNTVGGGGGLANKVKTVAGGTKLGTTAVVGTTATLVLAGNANRKSALIYNNGGSTCYLGVDNTVTVTNGMPLPTSAYVTDSDSTDAWYGISASPSQDFRIIETTVT